MKIIDRLVELGNNRVNETLATLTGGTLAYGGINDSWTLSDWSALVGMIYVLMMIAVKIYDFIKWLKKKKKKD